MDSKEASLWAESSPQNNQWLLAASVILFYEFATTFSQEVLSVWSSTVSRANVLFLLNRYLTLSYCITWYMPDQWVCTGSKTFVFDQVVNALQCLLLVIWAVFNAFRVHAIGGGASSWITAVTLLLGIVPVGTNIYNFIKMRLYTFPHGCLVMSDTTIHTQISLVAPTRICMIISDALVLVVIWRTTHTMKRTAADCSRPSLAAVLMRDGAMYFLVLLLLNILQIVLWATQLSLTMSTLVEIATSVLISRFFLNLRQEHSALGSIASDPSIMLMSDISFTSRIIGNMGASFDNEAPPMSTGMPLSDAEYAECEDEEVV